MRLINSGLEILEQQPGLDGMYKQIELAGRTCYHSEDKITEDSAKAFVDRMINSQHFAILEHGTVYLKITKDNSNIPPAMLFWRNGNKYSKVIQQDDVYYVTTNFRVIIENNRLDDLQYICEPTEYHEKRVTVKWACDRVTGESFLRHRVFSFARESTRYCNYTKDKFDNEIKFIIPSWVDIPECKIADWDGDWCDMDNFTIVKPRTGDATDSWLEACRNAEFFYNTAINNGWKAQQARQVLPFSVSSPLVMTGFLSDWPHFFELRCAPSAHPDAQKLAKELLVKLHEMYPGKFDDLYNKYIENGNND